MPPPPAKRYVAIKKLIDDGKIDAAEREAAAFLEAAPRVVGANTLYARCAVERGDWPAALERWASCRKRFPGQTFWSVPLAQALMMSDRFAEAEAGFRALLVKEPENFDALAGLALALGKTSPAAAEDVWLKVFDRSPAPPRPRWLIERALALQASGDFQQARAMIERTLDNDGARAPLAYRTLVSLLIDGGQHEQAARELATGRLRAGGGASDAQRMRLQVYLSDLSGARASFRAAMKRAREAPELLALFSSVAAAFEPPERRDHWRALREILDATPSALDTNLAMMRLRLDLALRDYDAFVARWPSAPTMVETWSSRFTRAHAILTSSRFPDFTAPKVFGIGLSKTGTTSLGLALDKLGYLQAHYLSPFSFEIVAEEDYWLFDAVTDIPAALKFETLYALFPNAKFILSERPFESWTESFRTHEDLYHRTSEFASLREAASQPGTARFTRDAASLNYAVYWRYSDRRAAYDAHHQRVERFFADKPRDKLLRHNIFAGHGWPELCQFLGRPIPGEPYPWTHRTAAKPAL